MNMVSQPRSSFPLKAVFLLVAGIGLLLTGARSGAGKISAGEPAACSCLGCCAVLGGLIGAPIGGRSDRWFRGAVAGFIWGGAIGSLAGLHLASETDIRQLILPCALLLVASLVVGFRSADRR
jgi:hypothetical protein